MFTFVIFGHRLRVLPHGLRFHEARRAEDESNILQRDMLSARVGVTTVFERCSFVMKHSDR
jgi:hypothetical protein